MPRQTGEPGTVTRKPDDVGSEGTAAAGGGRHTPEQAAITDMGPEAAARREPRDGWGESGEPGRSPSAFGGSSGGHSDQQAARGPAADAKVAGGHSRTEREGQR